MGLINDVNIYAFQAAKAIANFSNPWMNYLMAYLAASFIVVLRLIIIYMYMKKDMNVYAFVVAAVVFYAVSEVIKYIVKEPRPCTIQSLSWINNISCESSFSFPSNHATVITGLGFFLNNYKYLRWLYWAWVIAVLFGRVYLGVHYLSDVIAGVLISSMLYFVINRYRAKINSTANRIIRKVSPRLALEDKVN